MIKRELTHEEFHILCDMEMMEVEVSKKDVAYLPQCDTKGCTTHAPIKERGRLWCAECYLKEKKNVRNER